MTAPETASPLPIDREVAAELLRVITPALTARVRTDGLPLSARTVAVLRQLHDAAERPAGQPTADVGSEDHPTPTVELAVVEAARRLGCRPRWIRTLLESGRLRGRRVHPRMWLVDEASLDELRFGRTTRGRREDPAQC
ncbi:helix-turn-helix domain-containing protein [Streptomyces sediminimaris]|uniref:helix-turn-helix domain-containing protein n=1 Tax=Streptomyces sediminimaris TaxID=3383721 RepID=UPI00399A703F